MHTFYEPDPYYYDDYYYESYAYDFEADPIYAIPELVYVEPDPYYAPAPTYYYEPAPIYYDPAPVFEPVIIVDPVAVLVPAVTYSLDDMHTFYEPDPYYYDYYYESYSYYVEPDPIYAIPELVYVEPDPYYAPAPTYYYEPAPIYYDPVPVFEPVIIVEPVAVLVPAVTYSLDAAIATGTASGRITADDAIVDLAAADGRTGLQLATNPQFYQGPVAGLVKEWISLGNQNTNVAVSGPDWFIRTGSGNDAITVRSGTNVLDGGTGSNFLTGGTGQDTFFVDARNPPAPIWSTVVDFSTGDAATIWGIDPAQATLQWLDGLGSPGFTGVTLHATTPGAPTASLTLAGYTQADLASGTLLVAYGFEPVSGSHYMYIAHS